MLPAAGLDTEQHEAPVAATLAARLTADDELRGSSMIAWSDGITTMMADGSVARPIESAATAIAGAVLRASGSRMIALVVDTGPLQFLALTRKR